MWVFSKHGFFSIVKKDGGYHVRARHENDLVTLKEAVGGAFAKLELHMTPEADYVARVFIPDDLGGAWTGDEIIAEVMLVLGESVDYGNFKSEIGKIESQKDKLPYLHRVWNELFDFQCMRRFSGKGKGWKKIPY